MKGIVFTEFAEMVETSFGSDLLDQLFDEADLPSGGAYTAVGTYDHSEMVTLVVKLAELTGQPVPVLIKAFGKYLFGRFHQLYPIFFEGISDAFTFLSRIEGVIHVEVKKLYPDAQLPRFDITPLSPDRLRMCYHSDRHLGDLAEGLIEACIEHYSENIQIARQNLDQSGSQVEFILTRH